MELSKVEIINLITQLYLPLPGYWIDEIKNYPEAIKFLKEGYLELEEDCKDKYVINSKGREYLHTYIENFSIDFIKFMKSHQLSCSKEEIIHWYMKKYLLDNIDTAEDITEYICTNLENYGYSASLFHSSKIGWGYQIWKND